LNITRKLNTINTHKKVKYKIKYVCLDKGNQHLKIPRVFIQINMVTCKHMKLQIPNNMTIGHYSMKMTFYCTFVGLKYYPAFKSKRVATKNNEFHRQKN
jgi:hypothetical protein